MHSNERRAPTLAPLTDADVMIGHFAMVGLLVLAAVLCTVIVNATLTVKGAASREESNAIENISYLHYFFMYIGALAGVLLFAWSIIAAAAQFRRSARGWALLLLVAAAASLTASHSLLWGALSDTPIENMPIAEYWQSRLSVAALAIGCIIWAVWCWRMQRLRIHSDEWAGAETRIENSLKRATWRDLLHCLPGLFLSAGLTGIIVGVPVAWIALSNTHDPASGFWDAVALSAAGVVWFCLLQGAVLGMILFGLMALVRSGWVSGRVSITIGLTAAVFATVFLFTGLSLSFYQEIRELGLLAVVGATLLAVGLTFGVALSRNLLDLCRDRSRPVGVGDLVRITILAGVLLGVLPFIRWLGGRVKPSRGTLAAGSLVIAILIVVLLPSLFPTVRDFLDRIEFFLVSVIILLVVLLGYLLAPAGGGNWKARLAGLGLLAAASGLVIIHSDHAMARIRPRVFQHNPLGKCSLHMVERLVGPSELPAISPAKMTTTAATTGMPVRFGSSPTRRTAVMNELRKRRPLIIFIIWDAARPDHMNLFGYRRTHPPLLSTTPVLDANRDAFVRFTNAFSQATATACSMRHFFTGRYSSRWMLRKKGTAPFWTNELIRAGYDTFFLNIIGSDYNGISQNAFYRDMPADLRRRLELLDCAGSGELEPDHQPHARPLATRERVNRTDGKTRFIKCVQQDERLAVRDLLELLKMRKEAGSGCFAYIHMDATHTPWRKRAGLPDYGDSKKDVYDQSIRYEDTVTGELIDGLKKLGLWRRAILILAADHGTGLGDHDQYGGFYPYLEQIRIPLAIKLPGVAGRNVDAMVGLFDVGPTLVDIFRPRDLKNYEGRSLLPVILGRQRWPGRILFGLNAFADCYYLIQSDGLHYIRHRQFNYEQLYNWRTDPTERTDLIYVDRPATRRARTLMDWFLDVYGKGRTFNDPDHYQGPPGP